MSIRTLLLIFFSPLVVAMLFMFSLVEVSHLNELSESGQRLLSAVEGLQESAKSSEEEMAALLERELRSDYSFISRQVEEGIELNSLYLTRALETAASSTILESYMTSTTAFGRDIVAVQLEAMLENLIENYHLSEAAVLDVKGRELLRMAMEITPQGEDAQLGGMVLPNRTHDESASAWFKARAADTEHFLLIHQYNEEDFSEESPVPVLAYLCPLRYSGGKYSFRTGDTLGYLKLVIPVRELVARVFSHGGDFRGSLLITDAKNALLAQSTGGRNKTVESVRAFADVREYYVTNSPLLNGLLKLWVAVDRAEFRESSAILKRLTASFDDSLTRTRAATQNIHDANQRFVQKVAMSVVAAFVVLVLVAYIGSGWISRPLQELTAAAGRIATGELDLRPRLEGQSILEIRLLAENLNSMRGNLRNQIATLDQSVEARTQELTEANALLQKAKQDIEASYDKLKELDRLKTEFLSTVSHELRTPLTSILGFSAMINMKLNDVILPNVVSSDPKVQRAIPKVRRDIAIIQQESERLTSLINELLDIAKMESGKVEWKTEPFSLVEVANRAAHATEGLFAEKNLQLDLDFPEQLPELVGDPDRIMQVFVNLFSNAVKFTSAGEVQCRARLDNGELIVRVHDTGIGIPQTELSSIFDKFRQIEDTLRNKPHGTGLGLPICLEIINKHQGRIWAESIEGKGSVFSFTLPVDS